jgi:hypothetical protein
MSEALARTRTALEMQLAEYTRDVSAAVVIAEQAGIETNTLALANASAANIWHTIVAKAEVEEKLDALIEVVSQRYLSGRNGKINELYAIYKEEKQAPAKADRYSGSTPPMSDYRNPDVRIDKLQDQVARLEVQMSFLIDQNREIKALLQHYQAKPSPTLTGAQLMALLIAIMVVGSVIFSTVWLGGTK